MLPNFLIIGATKCGTTSLHQYLARHRDVYMHPQKEMRYFTTQHNLHRGLQWYRDQFADASGFSAIGEASNAYSRYPVYDGVPARIAKTLPGVRLVYLIRDPMRRIESHYRHRLVTGIEWRNAEDAIDADPRYIAASLYGQQIERYCRYFSRDRILVIRAERLFAEPEAWLGRLCSFLGVETGVAEDFRPENTTAERVVAPGVIRQFARFPRAKNSVKKAARAFQRLSSVRRAPTADQPVFELSQNTRRRLDALFADDHRLLVALMGDDLAARPSERSRIGDIDSRGTAGIAG